MLHVLGLILALVGLSMEGALVGLLMLNKGTLKMWRVLMTFGYGCLIVAMILLLYQNLSFSNLAH
jgi:hypothetical protein